ncbi:MAG TPA: hypothetical protein VM223_01775 [Planctomycetota bacterium]|nr:hypothetical protein [Planctomycetota bacterium]
MRKCPACNRYTLDFDEYFGRFRCFNADCRWMPPSSTERELRLIETRKEPRLLFKKKMPRLGLTMSSYYDSVNDALVFDFGQDEPSFDLPESDGRIIWKVGSSTGSVTGFAVIGMVKIGVIAVTVDLDVRKECIEESVRSFSGPPRRATRILIDRIAVATKTTAPRRHRKRDWLGEAVNESCARFEKAGAAKATAKG